MTKILPFLFIIIFALSSCQNKKFSIESPKDSTISKNSEVMLIGKIPKEHYLTINNQRVNVITGSGETDIFVIKFKLKRKINKIDFKTYHILTNNKHDSTQLTIFQNISDEEEKVIVQRELAIKQNLLKEEKARKLENLVEERRWNNSKAGRIFKKHPNWSKRDCERIADRSIWIGMHYDMLVYMRGRPNVANPSNYGNGTSYQYCWYNYTPSCFYDTNNDDLIDSYN